MGGGVPATVSMKELTHETHVGAVFASGLALTACEAGRPLFPLLPRRDAAIPVAASGRNRPPGLLLR